MSFRNHLKYLNKIFISILCVNGIYAEPFLGLERISYESSYKSDLSEYYRQAKSYRSPASVDDATEVDEFDLYKIREFKNVSQFAGLIYFKKGDMAKLCEKQVSSAKKLGFKGVSLFYPVHFSGGNSEQYNMPSEPLHGRHYRFEELNRPNRSELYNCLNVISKNKLNLQFIPHLESVKTLVDPENSEWRLKSGIPLDDFYYESAFGQFLDYLELTKNFSKEGDLMVTAFSEIDPMVLSYPKRSLSIVKKLKKDVFDRLGYKPKVSYNTNGDFYNGWDLPQSKQVSSCFYLKELIEEVDYISPSIYGDRGHVGFNNSMATYTDTKALFSKRMNKKLNELCNNKNYKISIASKRISLGEFALDQTSKMQSYTKFFNNKEAIIVTYWNHNKWDHHALYDGTIYSKRFYKELLISK